MELGLRGNMGAPLKYNNGGSRSFSRFRGAVSRRNGNWGSRITFKQKFHWLGTYDTEQDAAMAYDRAALKLLKADALLNFPVSVEEMRFQGLCSSVEILEMIKDQTYAPKLSDFLADGTLATRLRARMSCRLLFRKELTRNDVVNVEGLHIPREVAVQHFPTLAGGRGKKWMQLTFSDRNYRSWTFRYSFWKSTQTYVFTKGWRQFMKMSRLKARDSVVFYRCGPQGGNEGDRYDMIDVHRAGREINGGDENGAEIKLFGVSIGKRKRTEE